MNTTRFFGRSRPLGTWIAIVPLVCFASCTLEVNLEVVNRFPRHQSQITALVVDSAAGRIVAGDTKGFLSASQLIGNQLKPLASELVDARIGLLHPWWEDNSVLVGTKTGVLYNWRFMTGEIKPIFGSPNGESPTSVAWAPDNSHFIVGWTDGSISVHSRASGGEMVRGFSVGAEIAAVSFLNSKTIAVVTREPHSKILRGDWDSNQPLEELFPHNSTEITDAKALNSNLFLVGYFDGHAALVDVSAGKKMSRIEISESPIAAIDVYAPGEATLDDAEGNISLLDKEHNVKSLINVPGDCFQPVLLRENQCILRCSDGTFALATVYR